jgi:hypothetical protein
LLNTLRGGLKVKEMPYFMSNHLWYRFDFIKKMFVLTKYATEKAKKSYTDYLEHLKGGD